MTTAWFTVSLNRSFEILSMSHKKKLQICSYFKIGISVPKNANISGTIQAMKIPKLALCRRRLGLSSHIISRSTLICCWAKVMKYRIKFKSSLKNRVNLREVKNDGGFLQYYGVQNTSRGCISIHHYSHENISRIDDFFGNFGTFSKFTHLYVLYIFLTNYVQRMT